MRRHPAFSMRCCHRLSRLVPRPEDLEAARLAREKAEAPPEPQPRLTRAQLAARRAEIVRLFATGEYATQKELAAHLGLNKATVNQIIQAARRAGQLPPAGQAQNVAGCRK